MARLTGLSEQYIESCNLRISEPRFTKELLRDQGKTLGRYDSRLEGQDLDEAGETPDTTPVTRRCKASIRPCSTTMCART